MEHQKIMCTRKVLSIICICDLILIFKYIYIYLSKVSLAVYKEKLLFSKCLHIITGKLRGLGKSEGNIVFMTQFSSRTCKRRIFYFFFLQVLRVLISYFSHSLTSFFRAAEFKRSYCAGSKHAVNDWLQHLYC